MDHSQDVIQLADGRDVPRAAVESLDRFNDTWPGATLKQARAGIVATVLDVLYEPLRELHVKTYYDGCNWCMHCISLEPDGDPYMHPWPCDTARLIYSSDELDG